MNEPITALKNDRLIKALKRQPVDMTPVWIMRQAGRYLPEYRQVRAKAGDFLTLCQTPELACEVTLQPLARFDLDAAILFSDILTVPHAMGLPLTFAEGEGPVFGRTIQTQADIQQLANPDPEKELGYVMDAVRLIKQSLHQKVPLIGFAGSPWTLACYMVEGRGSKDFATVKKMLYREPALLQQLLQRLMVAVTHYLQAQIAAGVDVIMLFDTWGGLLSARDYKEFSLHYMQQIIAGVQSYASSLGRSIPTIIFTKNGGLWLEEIAAVSGCDAVGLDWTIDIAQARQRVGGKVALQGNLEPMALYSSPDRIRRCVAQLLEDFGPGEGHIANLGHGILPDVPPEHVAVFVDAVHEMSKPYHR